MELKGCIINSLPIDKIIDWSKLKQIVDRETTYKSALKMTNWVENIVRKGEIASQCFPKLYLFSASKCGIVWCWFFFFYNGIKTGDD